MKGKMYCPKIKLDGDYELNGRVLLLPVRGKGRSVIVLGRFGRKKRLLRLWWNHYNLNWGAGNAC